MRPGRRIREPRPLSALPTPLVFRLELVPSMVWATLGKGRKTFSCPSSLPRLDASRALATVESPHHLAWSGRTAFSLAHRHDRQRVYEVVPTEGLPRDIEALLDRVLLVDAWDDIFLRRDIRAPWQPLIDRALYG